MRLLQSWRGNPAHCKARAPAHHPHPCTSPPLAMLACCTAPAVATTGGLHTARSNLPQTKTAGTQKPQAFARRTLRCAAAADAPGSGTDAGPGRRDVLFSTGAMAAAAALIAPLARPMPAVGPGWQISLLVLDCSPRHTMASNSREPVFQVASCEPDERYLPDRTHRRQPTANRAAPRATNRRRRARSPPSMVGRCRLTVSKPILKAPMVSALEARN